MGRATSQTPGARGRDADATRPVRTVFLKRGAKTTVHRHAENATWIRVVSGEMLDERWSRDADGEVVHERKVLRSEQTVAATGDSLHRVQALQDTAFVTTCDESCGCAREADPDAVARLADDEGITAVGAPVPSVRPYRMPRRPLLKRVKKR